MERLEGFFSRLGKVDGEGLGGDAELEKIKKGFFHLLK